MPLQVMAQERTPIIDMHLHTYPIGSFWPPGAPNPATGVPSPETGEALLSETRAALDRYNIVLAVTSGCPFDLVLGWKQADPDRIVASPYIGGSRGCHAGYPYVDETIALLHAHPQVYADLAIINWVLPREEFHRYLRRLVQAGFLERLMFGSDQMIWPDAIGMAIDAIESAEFLTEEQKRDIFYNNAARFLRLSEEEVARHHER